MKVVNIALVVPLLVPANFTSLAIKMKGGAKTNMINKINQTFLF